MFWVEPVPGNLLLSMFITLSSYCLQHDLKILIFLKVKKEHLAPIC